MANIFYSDSIIEIDESTILFRQYYFPFGAKRIRLADIESIESLKPSLLNGKWRIHGTGDFRTWFPRDAKRPQRDRIFLMTLRNQRIRVGFTIERTDEFVALLKNSPVLSTHCQLKI